MKMKQLGTWVWLHNFGLLFCCLSQKKKKKKKKKKQKVKRGSRLVSRLGLGAAVNRKLKLD
ncbi:hypothetical protein ERO13_D01G086650v2 [Gossypium hirsutum]|nr:hypothetical protein ERO13_D01G086650v2 [Gossypium hirsutum]